MPTEISSEGCLSSLPNAADLVQTTQFDQDRASLHGRVRSRLFIHINGGAPSCAVLWRRVRQEQ